MFDQLGPEHAGSTHFGDLHKVIHPNSPEKRDAGSKIINVKSGFNTGAQIFESIGKGISQLDIAGSAGLLHVVARYRNGVELRHVFGGIFKDISDDAHRGFWGIDVGVAHHKFFENIILDGACQLLFGYSLLLGCDDIKRHNGNYGSVHGHGDRHLIQRNLVKKYFHIEDGIDSYPRFAHIAGHARMVGVVTAVSSQIEGNR